MGMMLISVQNCIVCSCPMTILFSFGNHNYVNSAMSVMHSRGIQLRCIFQRNIHIHRTSTYLQIWTFSEEADPPSLSRSFRGDFCGQHPRTQQANSNYSIQNVQHYKKCLYNFDTLTPHFYIIKLGFIGVYIIFLISALNIDCGYSLEPPHRGGSNEYAQFMFLSRNMKNIITLLSKKIRFW